MLTKFPKTFFFIQFQEFSKLSRKTLYVNAPRLQTASKIHFNISHHSTPLEYIPLHPAHPSLKAPSTKVKLTSMHQKERDSEVKCARLHGWRELFGTASTYLQCEVEPLLAVSFVVQTFLQPQGAALLLLVTDHVELLLLVSSHNAEGQLSIFSSVLVLCSELQDLWTSSDTTQGFSETYMTAKLICIPVAARKRSPEVI